jgi:vacuolar iron transporter family protein
MKKELAQLQTELDTAFLYEKIAELQTDESHKQVLLQLSKIEMRHAQHALEHVKKLDPTQVMPTPSMRARIQLALGKVFGYGAIVHSLMALEKNLARNTIISKQKQGVPITGFEHNHLKIIESLNEQPSFTISSGILKQMEGRHRSVGGNALRAAVLGANDGLVSNMSLVMGVAGAMVSDKTILLTGIAGLLAGAISMAMGEWLSVQSSRELYMNQIAMEEEELENAPEEEQKELALIYQAKGMSAVDASRFAQEVFQDKTRALDTLIFEELGIDKEELGGSAWEAAIASFVLFAVGAIIPLFPFFIFEGLTARYYSVGAGIIGLFLIGAASTLFTGKSVLFSGLRQIIFGLGAAAVTFGVGRLIGIQIMG